MRDRAEILGCQVIVRRALPGLYYRQATARLCWCVRVAVRTRLHRLSCTANGKSWPMVVKRERQADLTDAHHPWIRGALPADEADAGERSLEHASLFRVKRRWLGLGTSLLVGLGNLGRVLALNILRNLGLRFDLDFRDPHTTRSPRQLYALYLCNQGHIIPRKVPRVYCIRNGRQSRGRPRERLLSVLAAN
jgi:hypothetical protein